MKRTLFIYLIPLFLSTAILSAADTESANAQTATPTKVSSASDSLEVRLGQLLTRICQREVRQCPVKVNKITERRGVTTIYTSVGMSYYPVREENIAALVDSVRDILPLRYKGTKIEIVSEGKSLYDLIPLNLRTKTKGEKPFTNYSVGGSWVERSSRPFSIEKGLSNRHIAIWQSHGRYFDQQRNEWRWQRSLLWQTVEDLYTQSYVLPYLVPMLENAGACVVLPRERDFQTVELIADNDKGIDLLSEYVETIGTNRWQTLENGFAHLKTEYLTGENPFRAGTCRYVDVTHDTANRSRALWNVTIPKQDEYAVYVSYRTLPKSASDAHYTIHHAGGDTEYKVNQMIGGGTWVYLGTFTFREGKQNVVSLSNISSEKGKVVCADAVKIGGGMGNIARTVCDSLRIKGVEYLTETSGMPRYCEGSRYWLQWAGFDTEVYSPKNDTDDYKDDYMSRGEWVNALMGGSERLPKRDGLCVPIDISMAFHTDAGITDNDTTIGTLGIYYTKTQNGRFSGKISKYRSRDLTDMVMSQIINDVRHNFDDDFSRRGMWNRSYFEARVPSAPAMLLELLSHQNLADMQFGHDPDFKFTVARAIYKAILRYTSFQYGTSYCVAPLPVKEFAAVLGGNNTVRLSWQQTIDSLEPSAVAQKYVLYTRIGNGGFDNGRIVETNSVVVNQDPDTIYSYRITAINEGGESFPSQTLATYIASNAKGKIMIVNGFDRVAAPESDSCGFHNEFDSGIAYLRDVAFIGEQRIFDTEERRNRNDYAALGASYCDHEGQIVGGNTFDYPYLHGQSIAQAGYSFASIDAHALESDKEILTHYDAADVILGKQRTTAVGNDKQHFKYQCLPTQLQDALAQYLEGGGRLLLSGAYIATELCTEKHRTKSDLEFAEKILHIKFHTNRASRSGEVTTRVPSSPIHFANRTIRYCNDYRSDYYPVNSADAFLPVGDNTYPLMRYTDSRLVAAVGYTGNYSVVTLGFPFESITDEKERDRLMVDILNFLATSPNDDTCTK